mgnify:FL=1
MADVSLVGLLREERTRGQLILITGLLLAVLFVGLALVLNSAIYVENVSTRDAGDESRDVLEQRSMFTENLQSAIDNTNEVTNTSGSYTAVEDPFTRTATNWSSSVARENVKSGSVASVRVNSTTEGAELNQSDPTRNFTAGGVNSGNPSWTLAENVTDAGTFRLELQNQSLLDMSGGAVNQILNDADRVLLGGVLFHETFHVEIETVDDEVWRVYMFQAPDIGDEDKLYVYTEEPGEDILTIDQTVSSLIGNSCAGDVEGGTATVDIRNGTVGGSPCSDLSYYEDQIVGTEHEISYRNARTDGQISTAAAQEIVDNYDDSGRLSELDDGVDELLNLLTLGAFSNLEDDIIDIWADVGLAGDRADGTYEVVVDSRGERDNFNNVGDSGPTAQTVVYSADIVTTQRSGSVSLTTETEVRWSEAES